MAKRGGFPGGMPGNMNNLMKQAQRMQRQMEEAQKELEEKEVEAAAGGGAVKVKVSGKKEIVAVTIDPEVVDPEDVEMLEDLIMQQPTKPFVRWMKYLSHQWRRLQAALAEALDFNGCLQQSD